MPRFLRLQNTVIHVPSVSNVSMGTTCLGKPFLSISYHTSSKSICLSFKTWPECEEQFNTLKVAMKEIDTLLNEVPLTHQDIKEKPIEILMKGEEVIIATEVST
jgi:hypothetical protein